MAASSDDEIKVDYLSTNHPHTRGYFCKLEFSHISWNVCSEQGFRLMSNELDISDGSDLVSNFERFQPEDIFI